MEFSKQEKNYLLDIVRLVLTSCVGAGKKLEELSFSAVPDPKLAEKCGAFVTYHIKNGSEKELRGCIGHMEGNRCAHGIFRRFSRYAVFAC